MKEKINSDEILNKYEKDVIKNINKENFIKITKFLKQKQCDFIDEIIEDYLDLFSFEYVEFVDKYNKLEEKYGNNLLKEIKDDMNILEEFYM